MLKLFTRNKIKRSVIKNTKHYYFKITNAFEVVGYLLHTSDHYFILQQCYSFVKFIELNDLFEKYDKNSIYEFDYEIQKSLKKWVITYIFDNEDIGIYTNEKFDAWMTNWYSGWEKYLSKNDLSKDEHIRLNDVFNYTLKMIEEYFDDEENYTRITKNREIIGHFSEQFIVLKFEFSVRQEAGTLSFVK